MQLTRLEFAAIMQKIGRLTIFRDTTTINFMIYIFLFFISIVALFLTRSRGGVSFSLASIAVCLVALSATLRGYNLTGRQRTGFSIAAVLSVAVAFLVYGSRTIVRIDESGFDETRWCVAKSTLRAIQDYPIFGTGFGTFRAVFPIYRDIECGIYGLWDRAHNSFLEAYLGLGFPFALMLFIGFWYISNGLIIGFRDRRRFRCVPIMTAGAIGYMMLHSIVDFPLQIPGIAVFFAAMISAGLAISVARRTER